MRIAFFGGTFDPPHSGHIAIAQAAVARLALDQVLFAPVGSQPLKQDRIRSSFADRLNMVQLALEGRPRLIPSSADAPLPGGRPNYTFDTLVELKHGLSAEDALFCLIGADSLSTLAHWHRSQELLLLCDFIVAGRPGASLEQIERALPPGVEARDHHLAPDLTRIELSGAEGARSTLYLLPDLQVDISATEIRDALAEGSKTQNVLDPKVAEYIRAHALYQS